MWLQRTIRLEPRPRGIHLVTAEVLGDLPELAEFEVGLLHLLIQHTSASLTLNENASPEVRADLDTWLDRAVPEGAALGAAFLGRIGAGLETSMGDAARWASTERVVEPDPLWADATQGRYARFLELSGPV